MFRYGQKRNRALTAVGLLNRAFIPVQEPFSGAPFDRKQNTNSLPFWVHQKKVPGQQRVNKTRLSTLIEIGKPTWR